MSDQAPAGAAIAESGAASFMVMAHGWHNRHHTAPTETHPNQTEDAG